jgi:hypothetical protein
VENGSDDSQVNAKEPEGKLRKVVRMAVPEATPSGVSVTTLDGVFLAVAHGETTEKKEYASSAPNCFSTALIKIHLPARMVHL